MVWCLLQPLAMAGKTSPLDTIFEVLAREHREIEARFGHLQQLGAEHIDEARREFGALASHLLRHLRAEAEAVYPTLVRLDLASALGDHERLVRSIAELLALEVTPGEWLRAVTRLEAEVVRHIDLIECEMFPIAKRALTTSEAQHLAHAFGQLAHDAARPPS